jgi:hypothetical protein
MGTLSFSWVLHINITKESLGLNNHYSYMLHLQFELIPENTSLSAQ